MRPPPATKQAWAWVDLHPLRFDPKPAHHLYNQCFDALEFAACGFDGICCNAQHFNGCGLLPSRKRIAALARPPKPDRVAEEVACHDPQGRPTDAAHQLHQAVDGCHQVHYALVCQAGNVETQARLSEWNDRCDGRETARDPARF